jgi:xylulose-5-phosphate/fructose-6-phosphate phosphoketolase
MVVLNDLDRFHLVGDVVDRVPGLAPRAAYVKQFLRDKLIDHANYIRVHGQDMPEVRNWRWRSPSANRADDAGQQHGRAPRAPD